MSFSTLFSSARDKLARGERADTALNWLRVYAPKVEDRAFQAVVSRGSAVPGVVEARLYLTRAAHEMNDEIVERAKKLALDDLEAAKAIVVTGSIVR